MTMKTKEQNLQEVQSEGMMLSLELHNNKSRNKFIKKRLKELSIINNTLIQTSTEVAPKTD